jgi:hypothetical protein
MSDNIKEPKKDQTEEQENQTEEQEEDSDDSSRSPGVDRGVGEAVEPSKSTEIKGSTQKNQSESSSTAKKD